MKRLLLTLVVVSLLMPTGAMAGTQTGVTVGIDAPDTVTAGSDATATLTFADVSDVDGAGAYTVNVTYDPSAVSVSATGTAAFAVETAHPEPGVLRITGYTDGYPGPDGDGALASLTITGESETESANLGVAVETFADASGDSLTATGAGDSITVEAGTDPGDSDPGGGTTSPGSPTSPGDDTDAGTGDGATGGAAGSGGSAPQLAVEVANIDGGAAVAIENASSYTPVTMDLPSQTDTSASVERLALTFLTDQSAANITVRSMTSPGEGIEPTPAGASSVFSYVEVSHDTPDSEIATAVFNFTVSKERLAASNLDPNDVRLYRYNGSWEELDTQRVGQTETAYRFEAVSPGLSTFAIGTASKGANLTVTEVDLSSSTVDVGTEATVTATIENTGDAEGSFTATLEVDGSTVDSTQVTVAPGSSETVTFSPTFETAGEYDIAVSGMAAGTLVVEEQSTPTATAEPTPTATDTPTATATPTPTSGFGPGFGPLVTVLAVMGAALIAARRLR